jgi:hypothetical protein
MGVGCRAGKIPSETVAVVSVVVLGIKRGALGADCDAILIFLSSLGVHLRGRVGRATCHGSP